MTKLNITTEDDFLKLLFKVEPKDVNLKYIFDHIRNYAICGGMLGISVKVLAKPEGSDFLAVMFHFLAGGILFSMPWILFALNFAHGIFAFCAIREAKEINPYVFVTITFLLFLAACKLMIFALNI
jgi:hypothetical protein